VTWSWYYFGWVARRWWLSWASTLLLLPVALVARRDELSPVSVVALPFVIALGVVGLIDFARRRDELNAR